MKKYAIFPVIFTIISSGVIFMSGYTAASAEGFVTEDNFSAMFMGYRSSGGDGVTTLPCTEDWLFSDGVISMKNTPLAGELYSLHFKDYGFANFDFSFEARSEGGTPLLVAKMRKPGIPSRGYEGSGIGGYVDDDGYVVLQGGRFCFPEDRVQSKNGNVNDKMFRSESAVAGFNAEEYHIYRMVFLDQSVCFYVDGVKYFDFDCDTVGPETLLCGWMGMQAQGGKVSIKNVSLKAYDSYHNLTEAEPESGKLKVGCLGDSLTFGSGAYDDRGAMDSRQIYAGHLQSKLGEKLYVRNFGVGGRTVIQGTGSCIMDDPEFYFARAYRADIMCLMFGTNDSADHYWDMQKYIDGYKLLIDALKEYNPDMKIYLLTAPWMAGTISWLDDDKIDARARKYLYDTVAPENGLTVVDTYTPTKEAGASHQFDGIHFDSYGYSLMAKAVYDKMATEAEDSLVYESNVLSMRVGKIYELGYPTRILPSFISSATAVASVDGDGAVTALKAGKSVVKAALGSQRFNITVTVLEKQKDITISGVTAAEGVLRYGDALPALTVSAVCEGAPVEGTYSYFEGQYLIVGTHEYAFTFTPSSDDYTGKDGVVTLTVEKAVPSVAAPVLADVIVKKDTAVGTISLPEGFAFVDASAIIAEGRNEIRVEYTPADTEHYEKVTFTVTLNASVEKTQGNSTVLIAVLVSVALVAAGAVCFIMIKRKKKE